MDCKLGGDGGGRLLELRRRESSHYEGTGLNGGKALG